MASVNRVTIVGSAGRPAEVRYLPSGEALANISVATNYTNKDRNTGAKVEQTEWHRICFFGRLAEIAGQYLKKGSLVYIEGRLQTRKYTDKEGIERYTTEIIAEQMQMLGSGAAQSEEPSPSHPAMAPPEVRPAPLARPAPPPAPAGVRPPVESAWDE